MRAPQPLLAALSALLILACVPLDEGPDVGFYDSDAVVDEPIPPELCSDEAKLIYAIDSNERLYALHPPSKQLNLIGDIECGSSGNPYAMSISRAGVAYVLYWDSMGGCEGVYAVRVSDGECLGRTRFQCGAQGTTVFGMGFAADDPDSGAETLYIGTGAHPHPGALWSLDTQTWRLTRIGDLPGLPDMSGDANGALWGFFAWTSPPQVARIDKDTAAMTQITEHPQMPSRGSFTFAQWGGDFYLFHGPDQRTTIYRQPGEGGPLEVHMDTGGLNIVGAGVSTCAPTTFIGK